ncbi:ferrous iron transport protein B [soil metagenome]
MFQIEDPGPAVRKAYVKVSLVGNPNSGKTTLFNLLTGLNQKVANFPGVTVEKKTGSAKIFNSSNGKPTTFQITDLPGTYSLYPKSPDERIPFQVLCDPGDENHPDAVIIIADGTNLKRSLFLASQVIDLKIPVILALNMMDMVTKQGTDIQIDELERRIGVRVVPINARQGIGIEELKQALLIDLPVPEKDIFDTVSLQPKMLKEIREELNLRSDYAALQIAQHIDALADFHINKRQKDRIPEIVKEHQFDGPKTQSFETLERYKVINDILNASVVHPVTGRIPGWSKRIDQVLMHRVWGYVCFLGILFLMFQAIFTWASFPMDLIDQTFANLSHVLHDLLPKGVLNDLIVNGVLAGIGGIVIFIPQIALLFMFIAILEDTGYMARVSFLMDRLMRKFGLNGRSVIPLISGVACAVPAILSTRTIGSWKERLITILVTPLMSCSARLPVYTLLISLVVPNKLLWGVINIQGLVMMSLYLIGFIAALGAAALMQMFVKAKERAYFIMEIPVYRMPRWSNIFYAIVEKVRIFLFDAGKVIIAISIILWFLSSRGPGENYNQLSTQIDQLEQRGQLKGDVAYHLQAKRLEASYAGRMGHWLEPAIRPLGFDWKIGIALVTSFAAREVFVGTMSTIYSVGKDDNGLTVRDKMKAEINPQTGGPRYTVAVGWSLMLFYAFAMQCMSTMAVVRRETGGWKWPVIQFVFMAALAYLSSLVAFQLLN